MPNPGFKRVGQATCKIYMRFRADGGTCFILRQYKFLAFGQRGSEKCYTDLVLCAYRGQHVSHFSRETLPLKL